MLPLSARRAPKRQIKLSPTSIISPLGFLLAAVLYIVTNTLFNVIMPGVRLDVTEDGIYTLSHGTYQILREIDEPVEFHFFFSEQIGRDVPLYASYGRRIRELLSEIASASDGKVILYEYSPKPFSEDEEKAVSFGVQGVPVNQSGILAYFGLAGINSVDNVELIPFFQPDREKLLEYDLVRMIYALSNPTPVTVGIMSSLPIMGDMRAQIVGRVLVPWGIGKRLQTEFDIINLPESIDALPENVDVLMIVHPRALSKRAIYEIEQFLFHGGRAILFIDPKAESDVSLAPDVASSSTRGLQPLLEEWRIKVPDGQMVGDKSLALRVNAGSVAQPIPADFLVWLGVGDENLNQDDPVTSQLPMLNLASSGFITQENDSPLAVEPLIFSSRNSSPIAVKNVRGLIPDVLGLLEKFKPDNNIYVMAARLMGNVNTAFPDGPPPRTIKKTAQELVQSPDAVQLISSDGPINIIIVSDSDLLEDRFWLRKQQFFGREVEEEIAGNADFVVNALGNLAGSDALLTLRTRGVSQRHFERVREIERQAEGHLQDQDRILRNTLKEIQNKITDLESAHTIQNATSREETLKLSLTRDQRSDIEILRQEMHSTRKQLRAVQRGLREDVEKLEVWLQFVNIGLIPIIVSGIAVALGLIRIVRTRRKYMINQEARVT